MQFVTASTAAIPIRHSARLWGGKRKPRCGEEGHPGLGGGMSQTDAPSNPVASSSLPYFLYSLPPSYIL
jgi:hypothetical protein